MPPASEPDAVDFAKLDAALASAMTDLADSGAADLSVFVHLARAPSAGDEDRLRHLGVPRPPRRGTIVSATLSVRQVARLSHEDLVSQLRLSQRLDLLRRGGPPGGGPPGGGVDPFGGPQP